VPLIFATMDVMDTSTPRESSRTASIGPDALAFLESLQSSAPMGVGFVDRNFRYVRVNDAMAAINGPSVQEHIGRAVPEVVPARGPRSSRTIAESSTQPCPTSR
jgi:PAS domain S-box-containing protein